MGFQTDLDRMLTPKILDDNGSFICAHAAECQSSVHGKNWEFAGGQLSYVGSGYGEAPPKVLVVSMQVGDATAPVSMLQRADQIAERIGETPGQRNPHMRGTTRALQILHGLEPAAQSECLANGTHVLNAYAMANSTLCSALPSGGRSRRGKPTSIMLENCSEHLRTTIRVLAPSIVVSQGADTAKVMEQLADNIQAASDTVARIRIEDSEVIWCNLSHPAAGPPFSWSSLKPGSYFDNTVKPALELARKFALDSA